VREGSVSETYTVVGFFSALYNLRCYYCKTVNDGIW